MVLLLHLLLLLLLLLPVVEGRQPLPLAGHRDMAGQLAGGQDEEGLPAYQDVGVVGVVVHLHHAPCRQLQLQAGGGGGVHAGVADGFGFCR